jgi:hypothetical protein
MAFFNRHRRWPWVLLALLVVLVVGRLVATPIVEKVVSGSIEHMEGGYRGSISDVELSVLGMEVAMLDLKIVKSNGLVPVPFMHIPRFVLAVRFKNFRPYCELVGVGAQVNMVDAEDKAKQQFGPKFELKDLREQLPLELTAVRFEDGAFHFRKYDARPEIDLAVRKLNATWENLESCLPPGSRSCDSKLSGRAQVLRGGSLSLRGTFDRREGPDFVASARVDDIKPVQLNAMLLEYAKIDVQNGSIDLNVQYRSQGDNAQRLVIVPRLYDVRVMGSENKGEVKLWREMLAGVAAGYFERKRGTKAIAYKRNGPKGSWSIIDWEPGRLSAR